MNNLSWKKILFFSFAAGIYTGLINLIPFLQNTSFSDIAVTYEWWILFALFIVKYCEEPKEAMFKIFVFFLISQPLVYLVEIIFGQLSFSMAWLYYRQMWLPLTILTLPGGLIAFYAKKQGLLGDFVLALAGSIFAILGIYYTKTCISNFPRHILTAFLCFFSIYFTAKKLRKDKKSIRNTILITICITALIVVFAKLTGRSI